MPPPEDAVARIEELERELAALRADPIHGSFGEGLREREALLSEAERLVHLGCWMWDTATGVVRWSDELFRILGADPARDTPSAEAFFARVHSDDVARVRDGAQHGLETGAHVPIDFRVVRGDGVLRHVHMEGTTLATSGPPRLVGTVLDVTERRDLETRVRHSQKMEAIGALAGGVAHDFNNYLQVIFGHLDILGGMGLSSDERAEAIDQIREAAEHSQRLTRQLLLFSRRRVAEPEVVALEQLIDQGIPMYQSVVGDRIRLRRVRTGPDIRVRVDRSALEQVILNLVLNARDAMPDGGRLTLELDSVEIRDTIGNLRPGHYAVLTVEDTGCGMAPEVLPRVFEPFYSTKVEGRGTGLGLATAHGIITQNGGAIEIDTTLGQGTTVRVMLPLMGVQATSRTPSAAKRALARVLVVEDQVQVRQLVRRQLEGGGYDVMEAEHGLDALRTLHARDDIDLVLSDVSMPVMTGTELATRLATESPHIPVILMAALSDSNIAGVTTTVLDKPFAREDLLHAIHVALAARAPRVDGRSTHR